ncbi:hypothetical protein [Streptomyces sp. NPDC006012]|uniref:scabin-related ADP-ribosyltransferase n=1 Tax=Streptomyces sp. NPDC006012 TaxID=3364739 RepID=UPI00369FD941
MPRPEDWSALGMHGDPTPGDPTILANFQSGLHDTEELGNELTSGLNRILDKTGSGNGFVGKAAEALREKIDGHLKQFIDAIGQSFGVAADATAVYKTAVEEAQAKADQALNAAQGLSKEDPQLAALKNQVHAAQDEYNAAVRTYQNKLTEAEHLIRQPLSGWQLFLQAIGILEIILAIVGMIFGGWLGLLAFGLGMVIFIGTLVEFAEGKASLLDVVLSFVGILFPSTKGLNLGSLAKGVFNALKNLPKSLSAGVSKLGGTLSHVLTSGVTIKNIYNGVTALPGLVLRGLSGMASLAMKGVKVTAAGLKLLANTFRTDFQVATAGISSTIGKVAVYPISFGGRFLLGAVLPVDFFELGVSFKGAFKMGLGTRLLTPTAHLPQSVLGGGLHVGALTGGHGGLAGLPTGASFSGLGHGGLQGFDAGGLHGLNTGIDSSLGGLHGISLGTDIGGMNSSLTSLHSLNGVTRFDSVGNVMGIAGGLDAVGHMAAFDHATGFQRTAAGLLEPLPTHLGGTNLAGGHSLSDVGSSGLHALRGDLTPSGSGLSDSFSDAMSAVRVATGHVEDFHALGIPELRSIVDGDISGIRMTHDGISMQVGAESGTPTTLHVDYRGSGLTNGEGKQVVVAPEVHEALGTADIMAVHGGAHGLQSPPPAATAGHVTTDVKTGSAATTPVTADVKAGSVGTTPVTADVKTGALGTHALATDLKATAVDVKAGAGADVKEGAAVSSPAVEVKTGSVGASSVTTDVKTGSVGASSVTTDVKTGSVGASSVTTDVKTGSVGASSVTADVKTGWVGASSATADVKTGSMGAASTGGVKTGSTAGESVGGGIKKAARDLDDLSGGTKSLSSPERLAEAPETPSVTAQGDHLGVSARENLDLLGEREGTVDTAGAAPTTHVKTGPDAHLTGAERSLDDGSGAVLVGGHVALRPTPAPAPKPHPNAGGKPGPLSKYEAVTGGVAGKIGKERLTTWDEFELASAKLAGAKRELDLTGGQLGRPSENVDQAAAKLDAQQAEVALDIAKGKMSRLGMDAETIEGHLDALGIPGPRPSRMSGTAAEHGVAQAGKAGGDAGPVRVTHSEALPGHGRAGDGTAVGTKTGTTGVPAAVGKSLPFSPGEIERFWKLDGERIDALFGGPHDPLTGDRRELWRKFTQGRYDVGRLEGQVRGDQPHAGGSNGPSAHELKLQQDLSAAKNNLDELERQLDELGVDYTDMDRQLWDLHAQSLKEHPRLDGAGVQNPGESAKLDDLMTQLQAAEKAMPSAESKVSLAEKSHAAKAAKLQPLKDKLDQAQQGTNKGAIAKAEKDYTKAKEAEEKALADKTREQTGLQLVRDGLKKANDDLAAGVDLHVAARDFAQRDVHRYVEKFAGAGYLDVAEKLRAHAGELHLATKEALDSGRPVRWDQLSLSGKDVQQQAEKVLSQSKDLEGLLVGPVTKAGRTTSVDVQVTPELKNAALDLKKSAEHLGSMLEKGFIKDAARAGGVYALRAEHGPLSFAAGKLAQRVNHVLKDASLGDVVRVTDVFNMEKAVADFHDLAQVVRKFRSDKAYGEVPTGTQWKSVLPGNRTDLAHFGDLSKLTPEEQNNFVRELSQKNLERLNSDFEDLLKKHPGREQDFRRLLADLQDLPYRIKHATPAYHAIANSGLMSSQGDLARRDVKFLASGKSSVKNTSSLGNDDFVFFRMDVGDEKMVTRYGSTTLVFDANVLKEHGGWVSLHDQLHPLDRPAMQKVEVKEKTGPGGESTTKVFRTAQYDEGFNGVGKHAQWTYKYPHGAASDFTRTVTFEQEVFHGGDVIDALALSVVREVIHMGSEYADLVLKMSADDLGRLVSKLFRPEAKFGSGLPITPKTLDDLSTGGSKVSGVGPEPLHVHDPDGDGRYFPDGTMDPIGRWSGKHFDAGDDAFRSAEHGVQENSTKNVAQNLKDAKVSVQKSIDLTKEWKAGSSPERQQLIDGLLKKREGFLKEVTHLEKNWEAEVKRLHGDTSAKGEASGSKEGQPAKGGKPKGGNAKGAGVKTAGIKTAGIKTADVAGVDVKAADDVKAVAPKGPKPKGAGAKGAGAKASVKADVPAAVDNGLTDALKTNDGAGTGLKANDGAGTGLKASAPGRHADVPVGGSQAEAAAGHAGASSVPGDVHVTTTPGAGAARPVADTPLSEPKPSGPGASHPGASGPKVSGAEVSTSEVSGPKASESVVSAVSDSKVSESVVSEAAVSEVKVSESVVSKAAVSEPKVSESAVGGQVPERAVADAHDVPGVQGSKAAAPDDAGRVGPSAGLKGERRPDMLNPAVFKQQTSTSTGIRSLSGIRDLDQLLHKYQAVPQPNTAQRMDVLKELTAKAQRYLADGPNPQRVAGVELLVVQAEFELDVLSGAAHGMRPSRAETSALDVPASGSGSSSGAHADDSVSAQGVGDSGRLTPSEIQRLQDADAKRIDDLFGGSQHPLHDARVEAWGKLTQARNDVGRLQEQLGGERPHAGGSSGPSAHELQLRQDLSAAQADLDSAKQDLARLGLDPGRLDRDLSAVYKQSLKERPRAVAGAHQPSPHVAGEPHNLDKLLTEHTKTAGQVPSAKVRLEDATAARDNAKAKLQAANEKLAAEKDKYGNLPAPDKAAQRRLDSANNAVKSEEKNLTAAEGKLKVKEAEFDAANAKKATAWHALDSAVNDLVSAGTHSQQELSRLTDTFAAEADLDHAVRVQQHARELDIRARDGLGGPGSRPDQVIWRGQDVQQQVDQIRVQAAELEQILTSENTVTGKGKATDSGGLTSAEVQSHVDRLRSSVSRLDGVLGGFITDASRLGGGYALRNAHGPLVLAAGHLVELAQDAIRKAGPDEAVRLEKDFNTYRAVKGLRSGAPQWLREFRTGKAYADIPTGTQWHAVIPGSEGQWKAVFDDIETLTSKQEPPAHDLSKTELEKLRGEIVAKEKFVENLSQENIKNLRQEIDKLIGGKPPEQQQALLALKQRLLDLPYRIKHATPAYHAIANSGVMSSQGDLARRNVKHLASGKSSANNTSNLGNDDFVFFRMEVGDGAMDSRYGPTTVVFDAKVLKDQGGWVSLHDQLHPLDRKTMQELSLDKKTMPELGDATKVFRTAQYDEGFTDIGKRAQWTQAYPQNNGVTRTVTFEQEVFHGEHVVEALALSVIREVDSIGGAFPAHVLGLDTDGLGKVVSQLFRPEAKFGSGLPITPMNAVIHQGMPQPLHVVNEHGDGRYFADGTLDPVARAAGKQHDKASDALRQADNSKTTGYDIKAKDHLKDAKSYAQQSIDLTKKFQEGSTGERHDLAGKLLQQRQELFDQIDAKLTDWQSGSTAKGSAGKAPVSKTAVSKPSGSKTPAVQHSVSALSEAEGTRLHTALSTIFGEKTAQEMGPVARGLVEHGDFTRPTESGQTFGLTKRAFDKHSKALEGKGLVKRVNGGLLLTEHGGQVLLPHGARPELPAPAQPTSAHGAASASAHTDSPVTHDTGALRPDSGAGPQAHDTTVADVHTTAPKTPAGQVAEPKAFEPQPSHADVSGSKVSEPGVSKAESSGSKAVEPEVSKAEFSGSKAAEESHHLQSEHHRVDTVPHDHDLSSAHTGRPEESDSGKKARGKAPKGKAPKVKETQGAQADKAAKAAQHSKSVDSRLRPVLVQNGYATGDQFGVAAALHADPKLRLLLIRDSKDFRDRSTDIRDFYVASGIDSSRVVVRDLEEGKQAKDLKMEHWREINADVLPTVDADKMPRRKDFDNHLILTVGAATASVGKHFSSELRETLRTAWQLDDGHFTHELQQAVGSWLSGRGVPDVAERDVVVLWSRFSGKRGEIHVEHDTSHTGLAQILDGLKHRTTDRPRGPLVILAGDASAHSGRPSKFPVMAKQFRDSGLEVHDLTGFWKQPKGLDTWGGGSRIGQMRLFEYLNRASGGRLRHLGFRSGNLEAMALSGHQVRYLEEVGSNGGDRMAKWHAVGGSGQTADHALAPGYERIVIDHPPTRSGQLALEIKALRNQTEAKYKAQYKGQIPEEAKADVKNLTDMFEHPSWVPGGGDLPYVRNLKPVEDKHVKGFAESDVHQILDYLTSPHSHSVETPGTGHRVPSPGHTDVPTADHTVSPESSGPERGVPGETDIPRSLDTPPTHHAPDDVPQQHVFAPETAGAPGDAGDAVRQVPDAPDPLTAASPQPSGAGGKAPGTPPSPQPVAEGSPQVPVRMTAGGQIGGADRVLPSQEAAGTVTRDLVAHFDDVLTQAQRDTLRADLQAQLSREVWPSLSAMTRGESRTLTMDVAGFSGDITVRAKVTKAETEGAFKSLEFEDGSESLVRDGFQREARSAVTAGVLVKGKAAAYTDLTGILSSNWSRSESHRMVSSGRLFSRTKTSETALKLDVEVRLEFDFSAVSGTFGKRLPLGSGDGGGAGRVEVSTKVPVATAEADVRPPSAMQHYLPPARIEQTLALGGMDTVRDLFLVNADGERVSGTLHKALLGSLDDPRSLESYGKRAFGEGWPKVRELVLDRLGSLDSLQYRLKGMTAGEALEIDLGSDAGSLLVTAEVSSMKHLRNTDKTEFNTGSDVTRVYTHTKSSEHGVRATMNVQSADLHAGPTTVTGVGHAEFDREGALIGQESVRTGTAVKMKVPGAVFDGVATLSFVHRADPLGAAKPAVPGASTTAHGAPSATGGPHDTPSVSGRGSTPAAAPDGVDPAAPAPHGAAPDTTGGPVPPARGGRTQVGFQVLVEAADARPVSEPGAFSAATRPQGPRRTEAPPLHEGDHAWQPPATVWDDGLPSRTVVIDVLTGEERALDAPQLPRLGDLVDGIGRDYFGRDWAGVRPTAHDMTTREQLAATLPQITRGTTIRSTPLPMPLRSNAQFTLNGRLESLEFVRTLDAAEINLLSDVADELGGRLGSTVSHGQLAQSGVQPELASDFTLAVHAPGGGIAHRYRTGSGVSAGHSSVAGAKYPEPMAVYIATAGVDAHVGGAGEVAHGSSTDVRFVVAIPKSHAERYEVTEAGTQVFRRPAPAADAPHSIGDGPAVRPATADAATTQPVPAPTVNAARPDLTVRPPLRVTESGRIGNGDIVVDLPGDGVVKELKQQLSGTFGERWDQVEAEVGQFFDSIALQPRTAGLTGGDTWGGTFRAGPVTADIHITAADAKMTEYLRVEDKFEFELGTESATAAALQKDTHVRRTLWERAGFKTPHVSFTLGHVHHKESVGGHSVDVRGGVVSKNKSVEPAALFKGQVTYTVQVKVSDALPGFGSERTFTVTNDGQFAFPVRDLPADPATGAAHQPDQYYRVPDRIAESLRLGAEDVVLDARPVRVDRTPGVAGADGAPATGLVEDVLRQLDAHGPKVFGSAADWKTARAKLMERLPASEFQRRLKSMMSGQPWVVRVNGRQLTISASVKEMTHTANTRATEFNSATVDIAGGGRTETGAHGPQITSDGINVTVVGTSDPIAASPAEVFGGATVAHTTQAEHLADSSSGIRSAAGTKTKVPGSVFDGVARLHFEVRDHWRPFGHGVDTRVPKEAIGEQAQFKALREKVADLRQKLDAQGTGRPADAHETSGTVVATRDLPGGGAGDEARVGDPVSRPRSENDSLQTEYDAAKAEFDRALADHSVRIRNAVGAKRTGRGPLAFSAMTKRSFGVRVRSVGGAEIGFQAVLPSADAVKVPGAAEAVFKAPEPGYGRPQPPKRPGRQLPETELPKPPESLLTDGMSGGHLVRDLPDVHSLRGLLDSGGGKAFGGAWRDATRAGKPRSELVMGEFTKDRLMAELPKLTRGGELKGESFRVNGSEAWVSAKAEIVGLSHARPEPKAEVALAGEKYRVFTRRGLHSRQFFLLGQLGGVAGTLENKLGAAFTFGGGFRRRTRTDQVTGGRTFSNAKIPTPLEHFDGHVKFTFTFHHGGTDTEVSGVVLAGFSVPSSEITERVVVRQGHVFTRPGAGDHEPITLATGHPTDTVHGDASMHVTTSVHGDTSAHVGTSGHGDTSAHVGTSGHGDASVHADSSAHADPHTADVHNPADAPRVDKGKGRAEPTVDEHEATEAGAALTEARRLRAEAERVRSLMDDRHTVGVGGVDDADRTRLTHAEEQLEAARAAETLAEAHWTEVTHGRPLPFAVRREGPMPGLGGGAPHWSRPSQSGPGSGSARAVPAAPEGVVVSVDHVPSASHVIIDTDDGETYALVPSGPDLTVVHWVRDPSAAHGRPADPAAGKEAYEGDIAVQQNLLEKALTAAEDTPQLKKMLQRQMKSFEEDVRLFHILEERKVLEKLEPAQLAAVVLAERRALRTLAADQEKLTANLLRGKGDWRWARTYPFDERNVDQYIQRVQRHLREDLSLTVNVDLGAQVGDGTLLDSMARDERLLRNVWEVVPGYRDYFERRGAAEETMGYPASVKRTTHASGIYRPEPGLDAWDRSFAPTPADRADLPNYAALTSQLRPRGLAGYGKAVFHLKHDLMQRATFTPWDSFSPGRQGARSITGTGNMLPLLNHGPDQLVRLAFAEATDFQYDKELRLLRDAGELEHKLIGFFEAQLHGGVRWADVDRVVLVREGGTPAYEQKHQLEQVAKAKGLEFTVEILEPGAVRPTPAVVPAPHSRTALAPAAPGRDDTLLVAHTGEPEPVVAVSAHTSSTEPTPAQGMVATETPATAEERTVLGRTPESSGAAAPGVAGVSAPPSGPAHPNPAEAFETVRHQHPEPLARTERWTLWGHNGDTPHTSAYVIENGALGLRGVFVPPGPDGGLGSWHWYLPGETEPVTVTPLTLPATSPALGAVPAPRIAVEAGEHIQSALQSTSWSDGLHWRADDGEDLYVFGPAGAEHPEAVFADGLRPTGDTLVHVATHVSTRDTPDSAWVTATRKIGWLREQAAADASAADGLLGRYGWRYDIAAPGGVDVDTTLDLAGPHPERAEVLYPGGVDSRYIRGAQRLDGGRPVGQYLTNPGFIEPRAHRTPTEGSDR